jgi:hypothetical protein
MPDNDSPRRIAGSAVAAFDAQTEAEDAGIMYTPDQWSLARGSKTSIPTRVRREPVTVRMTQEQLRALTDACRAPAAPGVPRTK